MDRSSLQFSANDDCRDIVFFHVGQQVDVCQYPIGNHDQAFHSLPKQNLQMALKTCPFALRVSKDGEVRSLIDSVLDALQNWRAKRIRKIKYQHPENMVSLAPQR